MRRAPTGRVARKSLGEHLIDLLKRETLGLGHKEVRVHESTCTQPTWHLKRFREAGSPRSEPRVGRDGRGLILSVGDNLGELGFDVLGGRFLTTETNENITSLVELALLNEVTGRVGQEEQSTTENKTPGELDADWDAV